MDNYEIKRAALSLVADALDPLIKLPYEAHRWSNQIVVNSSTIRVMSVDFYDNQCAVISYEMFDGFGTLIHDGDVMRPWRLFEYANPAFPNNLVACIEKVIDHHACVLEAKKDEMVGLPRPLFSEADIDAIGMDLAKKILGAEQKPRPKVKKTNRLSLPTASRTKPPSGPKTRRS
jgi:hypothetical protein